MYRIILVKGYIDKKKKLLTLRECTKTNMK